MHKRMSTLVAAPILALALAATAFAATSGGKLKSFSYNSSTKVGHLTIINSTKGPSTYRLPAGTDCGVSYGQSGDQIPCKTLGKAKYDRKPVRVTWKRAANGDRVASLVAVDLS